MYVYDTVMRIEKRCCSFVKKYENRVSGGILILVMLKLCRTRVTVAFLSVVLILIY